jgi:tetratricopeptide (TPR) repeat protein
VKSYIKNNPNDDKAKIFLAQLLSWSGNDKEALKFLTEFENSNNYQAKLLLGKILAWQGNYEKAIPFLSDVYLHGNKSQKYQAQKTLAFIALWQDKKEKAKKIFEKLLKENPKDQDVQEALMVIEGNVRPLIKKYEKLLSKNPNNAEYILKLADYYYILKNYKKAAYYYEKYLQIHPDKIDIYKTLGDIYLQLKNYYKGFGDWEYYANYKNTKEAYLELAKRYYWNGFNKEALNVLNQLLRKYPNYEDAIILKAKILKVNPRFVNANSATTIKDYFDTKSQKILALGDRAYFAGLYKTAIDYYKEYLFLKPDDYQVMEKYAYALEYANEPAKAAGEFYLLMWWKKTPIIQYHYAYNLQRAGKIQKAEKIYKELLKEIPKPLPKFLKNFLDNWKKAWESMDFKKYASFYDEKTRNDLYWRLRKQSIFNRSSFISVGIYDPVLLSSKNHTYTIKFFQVYASKIEKDKGYKTLVVKCDANDTNCKIIKETWKPGKYVPYNPENSLEKYIKQNLSLIEKNKYSLVPMNKPNPETKNEKTLPPPPPPKPKPKKPSLPSLKKDANATNAKIILAPGEYKQLQSTAEALNFTYFQSVKLDRNDTISKEYAYLSQTPLYNWKLRYDLDYFVDNQQTRMWINYLKLSKHLYKNYYAYVFYRNYRLTQNGSNKNGFYYGVGLKKAPFLFDLFFDKSGKKTLGWDFEYSPFVSNGITLKINKRNMVYTRRSVCSANHTKLEIELTGYKSVTPYRDLWWSVAYEKVDDQNNVLTPQAEYDFYNTFIKKTPLVFYFSTWFQFNSKQTDCYYSPDKTDTNIIGIKIYKNLTAYLKGKIKAGVGYSFFDKSYVYNLGGWLLYDNNDNVTAKAGCSFSNSTPITQPSGSYKSLECVLSAGIIW